MNVGVAPGVMGVQLIITTLDSNRWVCQAKVKTALKLLRKTV